MNKNLKDFCLYVVVGATATAAEWLIFYTLNSFVGCHYIPATVIAYIISTFVNWLVGRILVFKNSKNSFLREIAGIYAASVIGLLLNMAIMWIAVDVLSINKMLSKIAATGIVFFWNFIIRRFFIYKKSED